MQKSAKNKRATLRDVARYAKVSVATVSRVLNDSALVSQATRERVEDTIEVLGFVPSAAARTLNSGNSRTIGALVPTLDHSIFARYLDALENQLSKQGYALIVSVTGGVPSVEERKAFGLLDLGVEGLVVSGCTHSTRFDALVDRFRVPVLITSYFDTEARYPTIGYDNRAIATKALRYLRSLGHQSVSVIHGATDVNDRILARIEAIREAAVDVTVKFWPVSMDVPGGADAVREMAKQKDWSSALLCLSDVQALGALFELQRQGVLVPRDISIMGFDDLEWSAVSAPGITSISLPAREMGTHAANALVAWIRTGERAQPMSIGAEIVVRGSTREV
ncbi:MAG: LacI family DNA-binding transcriptional regulator [Pseudomonadota bacterium]